MIKFDEWQKLDLRVAEIKKVEDHPNADKLFVMTVDVGDEKKQIVAGIRNHYKKEDLIGKKIIVFNNLEPVVLRGVESKGMLLAASNKDDVILITVDKNIKIGSKIS